MARAKLVLAIAEANAVLALLTQDDELGEPLFNAIAEANSALNNGDTTKAELDAALEELNKAIGRVGNSPCLTKNHLKNPPQERYYERAMVQITQFI